MAKVVMLQKDGVLEKGYVGFSWTTLFFNILIPAFRADIKNFLIMLFIDVFSISPFLYKTYFYYLEIEREKEGLINQLAHLFVETTYIDRLYLELTIQLIYVCLFALTISFIFALIYNKIYTKSLLRKGYRPVTEADNLLLKLHKLIIS